MRKNELGYDKRQKRKCLEYTISWSRYIEAKKETILNKFNEMTGIYIVFELNKYKRLAPIMLGIAWYSGLRTTLLKLFHRIAMDKLPDNILETVENKTTYIKYLEVYDLDDVRNIFFKIKDKYPEVYTDTHGLTCPENIKQVNVIDKFTKIYFKKQKVDI